MNPEKGHRVSRRATIAAIAAGALGAGGWATTVPEKETRRAEPSPLFMIYPGWIEDNITAAFLDPYNDGHIPFLTQGTEKNPVILSVAKAFFAHLEDLRKQGTRIGFGDALSFVLQKTSEEMRRFAPHRIAPNINWDLEVAHAGVFSLATGFNHKATGKQLQKLGVSSNGFKDTFDYYWGPRGLETVVSPRFFGVDNKEEDVKLIEKRRSARFQGTDRSAHVAHHLFLTTIYRILEYQKLPHVHTIPRLLQASMGFLSSPQQRALWLSKAAGFGYEVLGTLNSSNIPIGKPRQEVDEGLFDVMVEADLKANQFGALAGNELIRRMFNGLSLEPLLNELNDPKFAQLATEPILTCSAS